MTDYNKLIAELCEVSQRTSNSVNTRDICKKAAEEIKRLCEYITVMEKEVNTIGEILHRQNKAIDELRMERI